MNLVNTKPIRSFEAKRFLKLIDEITKDVPYCFLIQTNIFRNARERSL